MIYAKLFNLCNDRQVLITIDNGSKVGQWETKQRTNINHVDVGITSEQDSLEEAKKWLSNYCDRTAETFWVQMKMEVDAFEGGHYKLNRGFCRN